MTDYELEVENAKTLDDWAPPVEVEVPYIPQEAAPPDIADPFADADDAYEKAEVKEGGADLPDGKYQGFIAAVKPFRIAQGKRTGYAGITLRICVIVGEHRGETQSHMRSFHAQDADSMSWLKKDLAAIGVQDVMTAQGIKLRELCTERLDIFLDRVIEFQVKRTSSQDPEKPFINVYLNRVLTGVVIPDDLQHDAGANGAVAPQAQRF